MARKIWWSVTLDDCKIQTFTVHGPGGGGKDTSNTGVRIIHPPSGAVGEAREERRQSENKRKAFIRMSQDKRFKLWHRLECARRAGEKSIDELVEEAMQRHNLRIEVREEGVWIDSED